MQINSQQFIKSKEHILLYEVPFGCVTYMCNPLECRIEEINNDKNGTIEYSLYSTNQGEKKLLGFLKIVIQKDERELYIQEIKRAPGLYQDESYRGIGTILLQFAIQLSYEIGCDKLTLIAIKDSMIFHAMMGFIISDFVPDSKSLNTQLAAWIREGKKYKHLECSLAIMELTHERVESSKLWQENLKNCILPINSDVTSTRSVSEIKPVIVPVIRGVTTFQPEQTSVCGDSKSRLVAVLSS